MDKEKQKALKKNQSRLEDFIKVPRVIAELNQESETTFSEEEKKEILSQPEGIMRSAKLFNVLQTKENKTFFQLIKVLRRNYKDQESVISKIESEGITESDRVKLYVDVDNLNLVVRCMDNRFRCMSDPRVRLDVGLLAKEMETRSKLFTGSIYIEDNLPKEDTLWKRNYTSKLVKCWSDDRSQCSPTIQLCDEHICSSSNFNAVIIATNNENSAPLIGKALNQGLSVELWAFNGKLIDAVNRSYKEALESEKPRLVISLLDLMANAIVKVDRCLHINVLTKSQLEPELTKYGAVVRVELYVLHPQNSNRLEEEYLHKLEELASWPFVYYALTDPEVTGGTSRDFLFVFCQIKGDVQFSLSETIKRLNKNTKPPWCLDVVPFRHFKDKAPSRCEWLFSKCKMAPIPPKVLPQPEKPQDSPKHKEKMCKFFLRSTCWKGANCNFAHSEKEAWCRLCQTMGHFQGSIKCPRRGPSTEDYSDPWPPIGLSFDKESDVPVVEEPIRLPRPKPGRPKPPKPPSYTKQQKGNDRILYIQLTDTVHAN